ncbi:hypothetical protein PPERSA_07098 [Pseudocohnilembus persalinus]|uniref:Uncharacterized protein n=1 Tax=Pseudocohnilembus persalinus TaxID=266149 RepID=A0A0V0QXE6_PSEPJ|nr:hypothetical protein PPERSA_07098 [Pseudocohnilembus persalinus]|eukprot:KRX06935.1 hypothetical protein PPERSA_07098 [Pseudocohnilembus persalinus]
MNQSMKDNQNNDNIPFYINWYPNNMNVSQPQQNYPKRVGTAPLIDKRNMKQDQKQQEASIKYSNITQGPGNYSQYYKRNTAKIENSQVIVKDQQIQSSTGTNFYKKQNSYHNQSQQQKGKLNNVFEKNKQQLTEKYGRPLTSQQSKRIHQPNRYIFNQNLQQGIQNNSNIKSQLQQSQQVEKQTPSKIQNEFKQQQKSPIQKNRNTIQINQKSQSPSQNQKKDTVFDNSFETSQIAQFSFKPLKFQTKKNQQQQKEEELQEQQKKQEQIQEKQVQQENKKQLKNKMEDKHEIIQEKIEIKNMTEQEDDFNCFKDFNNDNNITNQFPDAYNNQKSPGQKEYKQDFQYSSEYGDEENSDDYNRESKQQNNYYKNSQKQTESQILDTMQKQDIQRENKSSYNDKRKIVPQKGTIQKSPKSKNLNQEQSSSGKKNKYKQQYQYKEDEDLSPNSSIEERQKRQAKKIQQYYEDDNEDEFDQFNGYYIQNCDSDEESLQINQEQLKIFEDFNKDRPTTAEQNIRKGRRKLNNQTLNQDHNLNQNKETLVNISFQQKNFNSDSPEINTDNYQKTENQQKQEEFEYQNMGLIECEPPSDNNKNQTRPPSRHKVPPKAIGLGLPQDQKVRGIEIKNMYQQQKNNQFNQTCTVMRNKNNQEEKYQVGKKLQNQKQSYRFLDEDDDEDNFLYNQNKNQYNNILDSKPQSSYVGSRNKLNQNNSNFGNTFHNQGSPIQNKDNNSSQLAYSKKYQQQNQNKQQQQKKKSGEIVIKYNKGTQQQKKKAQIPFQSTLDNDFLSLFATNNYN